jgi:hypothetical protein
MADVAITPANVVKGTGAKIDTGIAGVAITAGQTIYKDPTDGNKLKLADADAPTGSVRVPAGIALHGAAPNQPISYQYEGPIVIGGTVTQGLIYVQSDTPGGIMPAADLEAGDFTTVLGIAISATALSLKIHASGVSV